MFYNKILVQNSMFIQCVTYISFTVRHTSLFLLFTCFCLLAISVHSKFHSVQVIVHSTFLEKSTGKLLI